MKTVYTVAQLRAELAVRRAAGQRIAFAPTMGNLHQGHLQLMARARAVADFIVSSVFVNPLQFGPGEDFERYPRTLAQDQQKLTQAGVDLLFAPCEAELYPQGRQGLTSIRVPRASEGLESAFRPGHFEGVATVVNILLNLVQPDVALFGQKDYQQLAVIRQMVADLHLPIEIIGVATVRAADGLALSSRNQYLTAEQRARAPRLHQALTHIASQLQAGQRDFAGLCEAQHEHLRGQGFSVQYIAIRRPDLALPQADDDAYVVLAAAGLGSTRLIDNVQVCVQANIEALDKCR